MEMYPIYRLITEGVATKKEIDEYYTFKDIMKMNAVLDMKQEIKNQVDEITRPKA